MDYINSALWVAGNSLSSTEHEHTICSLSVSMQIDKSKRFLLLKKKSHETFEGLIAVFYNKSIYAVEENVTTFSF